MKVYHLHTSTWVHRVKGYCVHKIEHDISDVKNNDAIVYRIYDSNIIKVCSEKYFVRHFQPVLFTNKKFELKEK